MKLLRHFVAFEEDKDTGQVYKILAGYHQFHAVQKAMDAIVEASRPTGDRRCGVVWHTQGSGKSLTMLFCAGQIILHPAMDNPTIVALTDRNDLDDQLFGQFQRCHELLRQQPVQAESTAHLRELLQVASGGVVFTTIQKFMPDEKGGRMEPLSAAAEHRGHCRRGPPQPVRPDRRAGPEPAGCPAQCVVHRLHGHADREARRQHAGRVRRLPVDLRHPAGGRGRGRHACRSTTRSRIAKLALNESELPKVDAEFEEITEGEEIDRKEKLKTKWAALEALVGDPKRIKLIARDLVDHYERRLEAMDGKAMVVCMSRRICVDLYNEIIKLRPQWHNEDDEQGAIKIVMTGGASDKLEWQQHIRNKPRRKELAVRFKNPGDPFQIVIVRDMWLTGFDAPCLHTMYIDKPMRGHGLMQAIARVNRVFRDKPGGLVVDYLGLADQLKQALATYTESGGQGTPSIDTDGSRGRAAGEVRGLLRHDARLRLGEVDDRHAGRAVGADSARPGARLAAGGRQAAVHPGRDRPVAGLRPLRGPRRGNPPPRRHFLLPGRAGGIGQALGRADDGRRPGPCRPATRLQGDHCLRSR